LKLARIIVLPGDAKQTCSNARSAIISLERRVTPILYGRSQGCQNRSATTMPVIARTVGLLLISNIFMTFAWYAHLRNLSARPWLIAVAVSWGIAFFEYLFQVPANRIGHGSLTLGQLKIIQEVITLTVFVPFAWLYMREPVRLNYLWAGLCMLGAVYFVFRK
jgi:uncharacterized protein